MKNIIIAENLYQDTDNLKELISKLEFEDNLYGKEIKEFFYIPDGIVNYFINISGEQDLEIQPDTGTFRKPNNMIHFSNFYQHSLWRVAVALEDTTCKIYSHTESNVKTFFDLDQTNVEQFCLNNSFNADKWNVLHTINMSKNTVVFIRPWMFHSFTEEKLIQLFMLNAKV